MNPPTKSESTIRPVTIIYSWDVLPGKEAEFTSWLHGIHAAAVKWPGHLGVTTLRPPKGNHTFRSVLRFDTEKHLEAWLGSSDRHTWLSKLTGIADVHSHKTTGLETWFDVASFSLAPPPKWKMVVVTALAVYPLSVLLGIFVSPHISDLNIFLKAALFPLFVPAILTYFVLPFLTRHVFHNWLYGKPSSPSE